NRPGLAGEGPDPRRHPSFGRNRPKTCASPYWRRDPLKRAVLAVAALALVAASARAESAPQGKMGGIGFGAVLSPLSFALVEPQAAPTIGLRHWFNSGVGVDLAAGFYWAEVKPLPEKFTGYTGMIGFPISLKRASDKVNLILRPGFQYGQLE